MVFTSIDDVRQRIDSLDKQIIGLIYQRSLCVKAAAQFKKNTAQVRAPDRVQSVIDKVRAEAMQAEVSEDIIEITYRAMISAFIDYELREHDELSKK